MRGDNVGRDIEDVGDAVLSFSEVKALASGNPLVIEQAGVQADLAKYERLERAHLDQQGDLQRAVSWNRREASRMRRRAEVLGDAIGRRVGTSGDRFAMTIGDRQYTKRPDAEKALRDELAETFAWLAEDDDHRLPKRHVGTLGGFDIRVEGHGGTRPTLGLVTSFGEDVSASVWVQPDDLDPPDEDGESPSPMNLIARLEGPIHRLDNDRDRALADVDELLSEASSLETRVGEPFPHRDRLAELRHRHQEILDELAAQADVSPDEDPDADPADPTTRLDDLKNRPPDDPAPEGPSL